MPTLRFEGHSDDTFGEYAHFMDDYDCCASGAMIAFELSDGHGHGMFVGGQYSGKGWPRDLPGCWIVGVTQLDDDFPLPDWPMRFETGDYGPHLVIEAPEGIRMRCLNSGKEILA